MRKAILPVAALMMLAACSESPTGTATPQFATGANPHWIKGQTGCTTSTSSIACQIKVAGIGANGYVNVELEATAIVVYSCRNPAGHDAPGQTDRVRVGYASGTFTSDKNGQATGNLQSALAYAGRASLCPNVQWTLTRFELQNVQWSLSGEGSNKFGWFDLPTMSN